MIYGEVRRVVTFNLDKEDERALYEFSKNVKFGPLVKRYLREEFKRKQALKASTGSSITVHVGEDE